MSMTKEGLVAVVKSFHDLLVPSAEKDYSWRKFSKQLKGLSIEDAASVQITFGHRSLTVTSQAYGKKPAHLRHAINNGFTNKALTYAQCVPWEKEFGDALQLMFPVKPLDNKLLDSLQSPSAAPSLIQNMINKQLYLLENDKQFTISLTEGGLARMDKDNHCYGVVPMLNLS